MSVAIKSALKEISPGIPNSSVAELSSFCQRFYDATKSKPLNKNEIARYHICAFLTIEKFPNDEIPEPQISKIPLPPQQSYKLVEEFRYYLNEIKSPTKSPTKPDRQPLGERPISDGLMSESHGSVPTTPTRRGRMKNSPSGTGRNFKPHSPAIPSPLKKKFQDSAENSPSSSRQSSPYKEGITTNKNTYSTDIINISFPQLIQFCNTFYIPSSITKDLLQSFINKRHKFIKKSDWYLACGLVYAAYIRINHRLSQESIHFHDNVIKQLQNYQKGNLNKARISHYTTIINNDVKEEPWIVGLERKYIHGISSVNQHEIELSHKLGDTYEVYDRLGFMISLRNQLLTESQDQYFDNWSSNILNDL